MAVRIESHAEPIPGYTLVERLGGGGFGEVWKAVAPGGLHKAIKFVYGDLETVGGPDSTRADQELKAMARVKTIRHPFILSLERFDIIDGQLIIVMELADRSLWDRFRECRNRGMAGIPREELLGYLLETAEALDLMNLHHDLQHLDIKPQNLFLVHNHVKVADFGLVKDMEGRVASVTGGVTPVYAAPETFDGWVSRFSDQYSLAIVYQELLTGVRPFAGNNTRQLIMQHLQGQPNLEPLPHCDRPFIARALNKNPSDRHPNCLDLIRALKVADRESQRLSLPDLPTIPEEPMPTPVSHQLNAEGRLTPPAPQSSAGLSASQMLYAKATVTQSVNDPKAEEMPSRLQTAVTPPRHVMRAETGDGVLFPALVIGLGRMGRGVIQRLKTELKARFGPDAALPHLQFLAIDTDPEAIQTGIASTAAETEEVLLARLNRPSRYLRPRDLLPPVEEWLTPKMIHRIPRSLVTTGIRALGRLAFLDHYRAIAARLQRDLERITDSTALPASEQSTGLKLRSNWPRVYVVANLAGGTGSGMFLDVAYVVRSLLMDLGYSRPEVVGMFYLTPVEERSEAALPLANTYAALTELNHYMTQVQTFQARYEARAAPLMDAGAPFSRCFLIPLGKESQASSLGDLVAPAGDYLCRELFTPLGRACEKERKADAGTASESQTAHYHGFGLHIISFPRRALIHQAARRLCHRIVENWPHKGQGESAPLQQERMLQHMREMRVDPDGLRRQLDAALAKAIRKPPRELFAEWLEPAQAAVASGVPNPRGVIDAIRQCEDWMGGGNESGSARSAHVPNQMRDIAERLARPSGQELALIALGNLDLPGGRYGAADQAVRGTVAILEEWLQQAEHEVQQTGRETQAVMETLRQVVQECDVAVPPKKAEARRAQLCAGLWENVSKVPELRYRNIIAQHCASIYLSLRGHMSDQIKELNFCRGRFRELIAAFQPLEDADGVELPIRIDLPPHCRMIQGEGRSLDDAVVAIVRDMSPEQVAKHEAAIQTALHVQFPPLYQLCIAPSDRFRTLSRFLLAEAEKLLDSQLPPQDAAELLRGDSGEEQVLSDEAQTAYYEAMPATAEQRIGHSSEFCLLAVPASPAGQQLAESARESLPEVRVVSTANMSEVVCYRECSGLALPDLKQLGAFARDAYRASCSLEHFSPHTRQDVAHWTEVVPDVSSQRRPQDAPAMHR